MANNIFVRSGNATINASPELSNLVETLLSKAMPETREQLNRSMDRLYKNAQQNWIVRQPVFRRRKGGIVIKRETSKGSVNKLQKGILIEGEDLVAFVRNNAEYAWAIKIGEKSKNRQGTESEIQEGKRLSNELLWKPVKRSADEVAEALANDLMRAL